MTSTTTTPASLTGASRPPALTFIGILRSEWIKMITVRSTLWGYVLIAGLTIGLALLVAAVLPLDSTAAATPSRAPAALEGSPELRWLTITTIGVGFGQLVVMVIGALAITGEYGTGMIRSTFTAVPRRLPALFAKALVFAVSTFVLAAASITAAALLARLILVSRGLTPDLGDSGVWLALLGAAAYLTLLGVLALALGTIIRSTAGAIATALGLILVVPTVFGLLARLINADWLSNLGAFLPSSAGSRAYSYQPTAVVTDGMVTLDGIQGILVLLAWVVVAGGMAIALVKRRDV
ncbi:MAG: ABC transporter permease subunit [Rhodoglobus sp.]